MKFINNFDNLVHQIEIVVNSFQCNRLFSDVFMFYVHVYSPKDDDVSELIREIFGDGESLEKEQEENGDEMEMNCGMRHGTNY